MRSSHRDEDAAAAARMIAENRDFFRQRGFHLMMWGLLLTALFAVDAAMAFGYFNPAPGLDGWIWLVTAVMLVMLSYVFERYHAISPVNVLSRVLVRLWTGLGVALLIVGFLGGATRMMPVSAHAGTLAAMIGAGFFVSAVLVASRGIRILALLWWVAAAVLFFLTPPAAVFLMGCLTFAGMFLPGLSLYWTARVSPVGG